MMSSIVGSSLQYRFLVIVLAIVLLASGFNQIRAMPVDVLPEFSPPYVEIQTEAPGLSAQEVEDIVTVSLEQSMLAGVPWLESIRSKSMPGLSSIFLYFEPGTDLNRARQLVGERIALSAALLPAVSKKPVMIQPLSSANRFMIVGLSARDMSLMDLSVLARWTIAPRLMGVPGVAHIAIWGQRDRQLQVLVDPAKLQEKGVSLDQVIATTGNALWISPLTFLEASLPGTGGFIDTPNQRVSVWHVLPISSAEELGEVAVEGTERLLLKDVAQVVEDHPPLIGDAVINDTPNLLLVIEKLPGVNTLEVTRDVDEALAALQPGLPGVQFDSSIFRPANFLEMAIANLSQALVLAAILLVLVLGIFLYGWRTALISLVAILTSLAAALTVLYLRGATLNSMVLAGLVVALALIIDEAVVDVQNIVQHLRQNREEGGLLSARSVILAVSAPMRSGLFFATLITLLAALPLLFWNGMYGQIFRIIVVSYMLAVLAAMVTALAITPALSVILLSSKTFGVRESPLIARLQGSYRGMLARTVNRAGPAHVAIAVVIVAGIVAAPFLKRDQMLPPFREPYLTVKLEGAPGTSHIEMNRVMTLMGSELRSISGVENVGSHMGRAEFGDQVVNVNSGELWVTLDPQANYGATVAAVQAVVNSYAGMVREVRTYTEQILSQPQNVDPSHDITVRLYGEDMNVLRTEAERVEKALAGVSGVADIRPLLPVQEPTLQIKVDLSTAQTHGIKPGDVRRAAAVLISGILVGNLFEEQKIFDVVVWGTPELRDSISDVSNLLIPKPDGSLIRLGDVADVTMVPADTVINHEGISAYLDLGITVQGRSVTAVANDVDAAVHQLAYPVEYHAEVLTDHTERQAAQQRLLIASIVALAGIYLLLQASVKSWPLAFATFLLLLAALAGGVLTAWLTNGTLSVASLFGLLAVLGIATRNAITMISHYQHLETEKGETFGPELILRGSANRIASTVMTTLTTALVLLPFVFLGNIAGLEIVRPMAIIIIGGLVISTLLNLFVLPALYLRYGASREVDLELLAVPGSDLRVVATD
ncbi:MAG TPA: efflux RND transporter permease subunit [Anaerolineales bacterium]|nr:efflux RND transporter permease subunit [Anaerolineales bacterium]